MLTTKLAKRVLTKAEQEHLTEVNVRSMAQFRWNRQDHRETRERRGEEPCHVCCTIARASGTARSICGGWAGTTSVLSAGDSSPRPT